ncbi:MAG: hypothetical protein ACRC2T_06890 [Thermoguttaceae bacterium]
MSKHKKFIIDNRPSGFTIEPMAIRLLESQANLGEWDDTVIEYLTIVAIRRADGVYFFPEQIADKKTQKEIVDTAEQWISKFCCFSLNSLREKFLSRTKNLSDDIADFENFLNALALQEFECKAYESVWHPPQPHKTRLIRAVGVSKDVVLIKLKGHIEELIEARCSLPEVQLLEHIPALDSDLLWEIVKEHLPHLTKQKHDGLTWYCKYSLFPDDLSETITQCIQQLDNIDFPVHEDAMQLLLSLQYETNFMKTYNVADNKAFRALVSQHYDGADRKWKGNVFSICQQSENPDIEEISTDTPKTKGRKPTTKLFIQQVLLDENNEPMSPTEIWRIGESRGYYEKFEIRGEKSNMSNIIYASLSNSDEYEAVGSRPIRFRLKNFEEK